MPFYEYECQACKYYAEVMQKISDAPLIQCPSCGKRALKKLVSAPVFRLKGGGWYETDFKSDKEGKRNLHGADKEESKAESKADTKETKTEAKEAREAKETKETKEVKEPRTAASKARTATKTARRPGRSARAKSVHKRRR